MKAHKLITWCISSSKLHSDFSCLVPDFVHLWYSRWLQRSLTHRKFSLLKISKKQQWKLLHDENQKLRSPRDSSFGEEGNRFFHLCDFGKNVLKWTDRAPISNQMCWNTYLTSSWKSPSTSFKYIDNLFRLIVWNSNLKRQRRTTTAQTRLFWESCD